MTTKLLISTIFQRKSQYSAGIFAVQICTQWSSNSSCTLSWYGTKKTLPILHSGSIWKFPKILELQVQIPLTGKRESSKRRKKFKLIIMVKKFGSRASVKFTKSAKRIKLLPIRSLWESKKESVYQCLVSTVQVKQHFSKSSPVKSVKPTANVVSISIESQKTCNKPGCLLDTVHKAIPF